MCIRDRVWVCDSPGTLQPWDGRPVAQHVHSLWIADRDQPVWLLQLLVYDDDGEVVSYRRDPRITWRKSDHHVTVRGLRVLNPAVTLLFKTHLQNLRSKDCHDLSRLIGWMARGQATERSTNPPHA